MSWPLYKSGVTYLWFIVLMVVGWCWCALARLHKTTNIIMSNDYNYKILNQQKNAQDFNCNLNHKFSNIIYGQKCN